MPVLLAPRRGIVTPVPPPPVVVPPSTGTYGVDPTTIGPANAPRQPYGAPEVTIHPTTGSKQTVVNNASANAVIALAGSSTYSDVSNLVLQQGQKLVWDGDGTPPVLQGGKSIPIAIVYTANNAIYGIEVTGYVTNGYQSYAIMGSGSSNTGGNPFLTYQPSGNHDVAIQWCDIHTNGSNPGTYNDGGNNLVPGGGGLHLAGQNMLCEYSRIRYNGYIGYGGGENNLIFRYNEVAYNNSSTARSMLGISTSNFDGGIEAGGGKFVYGVGRDMHHNYVHHNAGPGMWCDAYNYDNHLYLNHLAYNTWESIFLELGGNGIVEQNYVEYGCWGDTGSSGPYSNASLSGVGGCRNDDTFGAAIQIVDSGGTPMFTPGMPTPTLASGGPSAGLGVVVRNNEGHHCRNGIIARQDGRVSPTHGTFAYMVDYVTATGNLMDDTGHNGFDAYEYSTLNNSHNSWDRNSYTNTRGQFFAASGELTFAQWQASGQDTHSTYS